MERMSHPYSLLEKVTVEEIVEEFRNTMVQLNASSWLDRKWRRLMAIFGQENFDDEILFALFDLQEKLWSEQIQRLPLAQRREIGKIVLQILEQLDQCLSRESIARWAGRNERIGGPLLAMISKHRERILSFLSGVLQELTPPEERSGPV